MSVMTASEYADSVAQLHRIRQRNADLSVLVARVTRRGDLVARVAHPRAWSPITNHRQNRR